MVQTDWATGAPPRGGERSDERAAQRRWLGVILGFFALQATLWTFAIWRTAGDDSFAVHPNYEAQAERWDATRAAQLASAELGWTIEMVAPTQRSAQPVIVQILICDRAGVPLPGVHGELEIFHGARAARSQSLILRETEPGRYEATAVLDRSGRWQLRGAVQQGAETLLVAQTFEL